MSNTNSTLQHKVAMLWFAEHGTLDTLPRDTLPKHMQPPTDLEIAFTKVDVSSVYPEVMKVVCAGFKSLTTPIFEKKSNSYITFDTIRKFLLDSKIKDKIDMHTVLPIFPSDDKTYMTSKGLFLENYDSYDLDVLYHEITLHLMAGGGGIFTGEQAIFVSNLLNSFTSFLTMPWSDFCMLASISKSVDQTIFDLLKDYGLTIPTLLEMMNKLHTIFHLNLEGDIIFIPEGMDMLMTLSIEEFLDIQSKGLKFSMKGDQILLGGEHYGYNSI